jgi:hypothetical protein
MNILYIDFREGGSALFFRWLFVILIDIVKVKLCLCFLTERHTTKAYLGSGDIAPLIH